MTDLNSNEVKDLIYETLLQFGEPLSTAELLKHFTLQDIDVTRGQILHILTKVKQGKIKELCLVTNKQGILAFALRSDMDMIDFIIEKEIVVSLDQISAILEDEDKMLQVMFYKQIKRLVDEFKDKLKSYNSN